MNILIVTIQSNTLNLIDLNGLARSYKYILVKAVAVFKLANIINSSSR